MSKKQTPAANALDLSEFHAAVQDELERFEYHETQKLSKSQKKILQTRLNTQPTDLLMLIRDIGSGGEEETIPFPRNPKGASALRYRILRISTYLRTREQTVHITGNPLTPQEQELALATAKIRMEITYEPPEPVPGVEQTSYLRIYSIDATDDFASLRAAVARRFKRHEEQIFGAAQAPAQAPTAQAHMPEPPQRMTQEDIINKYFNK